MLLSGVIILTAVSVTLYRNRRTEIVTSLRADHSVVIYMVGDPDFPFGSTHCLAVLKKGRKIIQKQSIELKNDGKTADASNFAIIWNDDSVIIRANAEEMADEEYVMFIRK